MLSEPPPARPREVLLLFSRETYPSGKKLYTEHAAILQQAVGENPDVVFLTGYLEELLFMYDGQVLSVREPRNGRDLADFDLVFFQKWMVLPQHAMAAAQYLQHKQRAFMSREVLAQNPMSKLTELLRLVGARLPVPRTLVGPLSAVQRAVSDPQPLFTAPFIVKDMYGTQGKHNFLVQDVQELEMLGPQFPKITFLVQEFIANKSDYRLTIVDGKPQYLLQRTRTPGTHLNNISQGSAGALMALESLGPRILADALRAATVMGRQDFAGVDLILDSEGRHWILEVNKSPEIQTGYGHERKSQIFVDCLRRRFGMSGNGAHER